MPLDSTNAPRGIGRRDFIERLGVLGLAGLVPAALLGGCETLLEQIRNRPVRRRLRTGSAEVDADIAIYKEAVSLMKARPGSDPRSLAAQAAIHGTVGGGFNLCQHGTNHFFSWHRAYLLYFERICQTLTGEKKFGLPYWNWNRNPALHSEFTNAASSLFHPRSNTSVAGNAVFGNAVLNSIFADTNFFSFGSQIEGSPHNSAHIVIGQDMGSGGSALDPIFWAHHCMVDYCWAKWNIELDNDNTNDPAWFSTSWNHFVDGNGNAANVTAGITVLMPLLSYRYEPSTIGGFDIALDVAALNVQELRKVQDRLEKGADVRFDIKRRVLIARGARLLLARPFVGQAAASAREFANLIEADKPAERIFVRVNNAQLPATSNFFVRVFINLPAANAQTPTDDPHYAGSFAFFGGAHGGHHGAHRPKTEFLVNVSDALRRLRRSGNLRADDPLTVQLVAVPVPGATLPSQAELVLEEIELIVSPVYVRAR
jgi:tyrosinase